VYLSVRFLQDLQEKPEQFLPNHLYESPNKLFTTLAIQRESSAKMHAKALLATILLSTMVVATPMPGKNKPISAAEWDALKNGGLKARRGQNVPISNDEMARLKEGGLLQRDGGLEARDSVMNCGKSFTGDTRIGGSGKWVPRTQFERLAEEFCELSFSFFFCILYHPKGNRLLTRGD
jgi:hypothetical protein